MNSQEEHNALIEKIAQQHLWVPTLEERKMDSLDFYNLSVWSIKSALEAAFAAGKSSQSNP